MQLFLALILIAVPITVAVLPLDTAQPQFSAEPINRWQFSIEKPFPVPFGKMGARMKEGLRCDAVHTFSQYFLLERSGCVS